ncbi:putative protease S8 tripeptidyl peptidase I [Xylariaceae sp. FL0804]|nr:putative protease S8 tripeptidyl peptidase I [Xylariaceae sp. FL0804]
MQQRMQSTFLAVLGLLGFAIAGTSVPATHTLHERRELSSSRWIKRDRVAAHRQLPVRIGLAQSNLDKAHDYLMEVSDPTSAKYGQIWTAEEVVKTFEPADEAVEAVLDWLKGHGIENVTHSDNKGWIAFDHPASGVEALLYTEYHEYHDSISGNVLPACEEYHVPAKIQQHIDYITPGIKLMGPVKSEVTDLSGGLQKRGRSRKSALHYKTNWEPPQGSDPSSDLSTCDVTITPACVAALYHIPKATTADPSNSMGIFEAELQFWDQEDLNLFFANYTPYIHQGTHPIDHNIDGGVARTANVSEAGGEAMLDLELAYPIVHPQTVTVWNVDDLHYQTWANDTYTWGFNTLLDAIDGSYCTYSAYGETGDAAGIDPTYPDPAPGGYRGELQCGVFAPTNVISLSYGGQEADVPIAYQKRQCNEYLKLGLRGVSLLFASGDAGVGNYPAPYGTDGPTGCLGPDGDVFNPTWPNSCPYVTNVGATKVYPGYGVSDPESAVYDPAGYPYSVNYSSGGGFSNVYPAPAYQRGAVAAFFRDHDPAYPYYSALARDAPNPVLPNVTQLSGGSGGIYNRIGRGIPDVAANGDNIGVYVNGEFGRSGGTSASTPIFASVINRIIDERLAAGKGPLGFLNPALYANPGMMNDITNGTNPGCGTLGFSAVEGWDPVTGLGTPNYPKMLSYFLSLP